MDFIKTSVKRIFQYEAKFILKKCKPKIIAITGSVGKTTTRDFLYSILSKKFFVRKSEKSFTTELGVPLSIIGCSYGSGSIFRWLVNILIGLRLMVYCKRYPEWLILEIDGDKPGDISKISKWLKIDVLIITAIGSVPSHIEYFNSDLDKFLSEKQNLINIINREGVIIYNADDESTGRLVNSSEVKKISVGFGGDCKFKSGDYEILSGNKNGKATPIGMTFEISFGEEKRKIKITDSIGVHNQYAALLSVASAKELGISFSDSVGYIEKSTLLPGRMRIIPGIKNTTIIDDSYNSSPVAIKQSIEVFSRVLSSNRKIAVIGDMLELGRFSSEEHKRLAIFLKDAVSHVISVGIRAKRINEELLSLNFDSANIFNFNFSEEAGEFLQDFIEEGDIILIKGSQGMRMERVVEEIMRYPEDKEKLLVRQEPEWQER